MKISGNWILLSLVVLASSAWAADKKAEPAAASAEPEAEQVNVDKIKEKYWARGDERELGVVQNRLYSKEHKFELGVYYGFMTTDPFLSVNNVGLSAGYHFSEYFGLRYLYWKDNASSSSALTYMQDKLGTTANVNIPKYYTGLEGQASLIYGKLSLLGRHIIYYDLHFLAGAGYTSTGTGNYFTPHVGLGQQVFLSKAFSVNIDYRLQRYHETIIERVIPARFGQVQGERDNWTNVITIGVSFLFGKSAEQSQ